ncbi:hypothetical protein BDY17DRAFT_120836 [Neohortaea acidophila]|uniref:Uncharacterized protein n=1 Tax=Neohortaea acidophila TaxID=245834 RepID=A0A6A6PWL8_9PEZI|nr:uncharacterized protein BDY17DRAFT_120836 [Neohortaea acidophila]KAF2484069.1 hypothetical protein BDY17DRAFT_120836 [Neohortaea acidophila]
MLCRVCSVRRARVDLFRQLAFPSQWHLVSARTYSAIASTQRDSSAKQSPRGVVSPSLWAANGLVITTAPSRTNTDQLLDAITQNEVKSDIPPNSSATPVLSLLLTPSFAQSAFDPNIALKAWKRITGLEAFPGPLHAITAVVDRLPFGKRSAGSEGLAYHLSFDQAPPSYPDHEQRQPRVQGRQAQYQDKPGSLTFRTAPVGALTWSVQLPLAQTIFSTGRVSTITHTQYVPDASNRLQLHEYKDCTSVTVSLPSRGATHVGLDLPITPLAPPRLVRHSMGNIVREVSSSLLSSAIHDGESTATQPASQELEQMISEYFVAKKMQPQPVAVWALVVPSDLQGQSNSDSTTMLNMDIDQIKRWWNHSPDSSTHGDSLTPLNAEILRLVEQGARICKVLSGGGGWGKKAGLLSLDPDASYDPQKPQGLPDTFHSVLDAATGAEAFKHAQAKALGETVKEGDAVMFLLGHHGPREPSNRQEYEAVEDQGSLFGALPSSIDATAIPEQSSPGGLAEEASVRHCPGTFGLLSEGGMAITLTPSAAGRGSSVGSTGVFRTKLDVPYARLQFRSYSTSRVSSQQPHETIDVPDILRKQTIVSTARSSAKPGASTRDQQPTSNQQRPQHAKTPARSSSHDIENTAATTKPTFRIGASQHAPRKDLLHSSGTTLLPHETLDEPLPSNTRTPKPEPSKKLHSRPKRSSSPDNATLTNTPEKQRQTRIRYVQRTFSKGVRRVYLTPESFSQQHSEELHEQYQARARRRAAIKQHRKTSVMQDAMNSSSDAFGSVEPQPFGEEGSSASLLDERAKRDLVADALGFVRR